MLNLLYPYPVIEHPQKPKNLSGKPLLSGYQSHMWSLGNHTKVAVNLKEKC